MENNICGDGSTVDTLPTAYAAQLNIGVYRINKNSPQNVYLIAQAAFSASTLSAYGFISARRRR